MISKREIIIILTSFILFIFITLLIVVYYSNPIQPTPCRDWNEIEDTTNTSLSVMESRHWSRFELKHVLNSVPVSFITCDCQPGHKLPDNLKRLEIEDIFKKWVNNTGHVALINDEWVISNDYKDFEHKSYVKVDLESDELEWDELDFTINWSMGELLAEVNHDSDKNYREQTISQCGESKVSKSADCELVTNILEGLIKLLMDIGKILFVGLNAEIGEFEIGWSFPWVLFKIALKTISSI